MGPWTARVMAEQRMAELRADGAGRGRYAAAHGDRVRRTGPPSTRRWQHLSEWAGYKMIGIGCRLARPAVVARAQAEL
jgi:hypothetical protein